MLPFPLAINNNFFGLQTWTILSYLLFALNASLKWHRSGTSTQSFWTLFQRCWTINKTFNLSGFFSTVFWWEKDPLVKNSDLLVTKSRDSSWTSSFWINLGNRFLVNSYVHCWVGSYFRISFLVLEINNKMLKKMTTINVYLKKDMFQHYCTAICNICGWSLPDLNLWQWHSAKTP